MFSELVVILIFALVGANFVLVFLLTFAGKKYVENALANFRSDVERIHTRIDNERIELEEQIEAERAQQHESLFNTYRMFQKEVESIKGSVSN